MMRLCCRALLVLGAALAGFLALFVQMSTLHPFTAGESPLLTDRWSTLPPTAEDLPGILPNMSGKTVLITGANAGLGLSSAKAIARAGATLLLACRSEGRCQRAANDVRRAAG